MPRWGRPRPPSQGRVFASAAVSPEHRPRRMRDRALCSRTRLPGPDCHVRHERDAAPSHLSNSFFSASLADRDPEIAGAIELELGRQRDEIELIASENIVSRAVLEAQGSVMTNKYAEGYPGRRYYGGCQFVDIAENLAIERAKRLFGCSFANVQPNSGSQANQARVHGADEARRHLHGPRPRRRRPPDPRLAASTCRASGSTSVSYGVRPEDQLHRHGRGRAARPRAQAEGDHRRRLGLCRAIWDFARFREIADEVGAYLHGRHGAFRRPRRRRRASRRRSRMPMSSPPPRTRPCAARAAA